MKKVYSKAVFTVRTLGACITLNVNSLICLSNKMHLEAVNAPLAPSHFGT